jgi:hypothetical protein
VQTSPRAVNRRFSRVNCRFVPAIDPLGWNHRVYMLRTHELMAGRHSSTQKEVRSLGQCLFILSRIYGDRLLQFPLHETDATTHVDPESDVSKVAG